MTLKTSFVTVLAAALVAVPAAWGQSSPDAFERAVAAQQALDPTPIVSPDAVERAVAAKMALDSTPITSPDAFDRAIRQAETPSVATSTSSSGRNIEWAQIGMGFGLGIVLATGLFLALRYTRIRTLAH